MAKIWCPKCKWKPSPSDRWCCSPGCQIWWNTFETQAKCPKCGKQWHETLCLSCRLWSPHFEWYHEEIKEEVPDKVEKTVGQGVGNVVDS